MEVYQSFLPECKIDIIQDNSELVNLKVKIVDNSAITVDKVHAVNILEMSKMSAGGTILLLLCKLNFRRAKKKLHHGASEKKKKGTKLVVDKANTGQKQVGGR